MFVDLHTHTVHSDGTWSPRELVERAHRAGIVALAVTDHDTMDGVPEAEIAALECGIGFVTGVEVSATWRGRVLHVLGYGVDTQNAGLRRFLASNRRMLEERNRLALHAIASSDGGFCVTECEGWDEPAALGGWKELNFLITRGLCNDVDDYFARYGPLLRSLPSPEFAPASDVVCEIQRSGGVALLAHPGETLRGDNERGYIGEVMELGFDGLECFHPEHSRDYARWLRAACDREQWLVSGGSDCHGEFVAYRPLNGQRVRSVDVAELLSAVGAGS